MHRHRLPTLCFGIVLALGCATQSPFERLPGHFEVATPGVRLERVKSDYRGTGTFVTAGFFMALVPPAWRMIPSLADLDGIHTVKFRVHGEATAVRAHLEEATPRTLAAEGLVPVVTVSEDGRRVWVYCRVEGREIPEMVIATAEADELTLVRVDGDLEELLELALDW